MVTYERINGNAEQEQGEKDTQLYNTVKSKVIKKRHHFITLIDQTLKKCEYLLKNGADPSKLRLSEEDLQKLSKKQKKYYYNFSKKLDKLAAQIKASQLQNNSHRGSYDSGIESGGSDIEDDYEYSDTTPLIPRSVEKPESEEKTSSVKKKAGLSIKKIRNEFKKFKRTIHRIRTQKSAINEIKKENAETQINHDTTNNNESDNLQSIALLNGNKKCEFLDELIKKIPQENLAQLINGENKEKKTPLQIALIAKIAKEKHKSNKPKEGDNTLNFLSKLLEFGADSNQLELPAKDLEQLSEKQKDYYRHFLKKLDRLMKKSELNQEITNKVIIKIAEIVEGGYPLHSAVRGGKKNKLNDLLQRGYDVTTQDAEGNTVLHYAIKLEKTIRYDFTALILEKNKELLNTKNNDRLTPIYILLERIQKKNEDRSCTDRKFEETGRYQTLKLLLENGADISLKDDKKNNVLHHIASLKGEQKVTCLKLILYLVKEGVILENQLSEAIKATNKEGNTPLRVALTEKAVKEKIKYLRQGTIFDPKTTCDNTTKFCAMLLQRGANLDSLELKDKKFHTVSYYLLLRDLKNFPETPQEAQEKAKTLKEKLEKKYGCQTPLKKVKSDVKSAVENIWSGLRTAWKHIDPARRTCIVAVMAITITIITMTAVAFFEGKVAIEAAIPIIVIAGICLVLTLGFNIIKKFCKSLTTDKHSTSDEKNHFNSTTERNQTSEALTNNDQLNLENNSENLAVQELSNQSEYAGTPNTKMNEPSIMRQFINSINRYLGFSTG